MNGTTQTIPAIRTPFPALSENKFLRYFNFVALYLAQGIPEGMLFYGIPAWMAMNGNSPTQIGAFVAACGLPWSFKIVVAPLMDRFSFLPMGRRRPWVLFGQLGLMVTFIIMSLIPDPLNNLAVLMMAGFSVSFFGAFQDVATDGMAVDIIPVAEQAKANGLMWGSKIIGISSSLALGTWMLHEYGFGNAIRMLSIMVCLIMLVPLSLRERTGERLLPWTSGVASPESIKMKISSWKTIFSSLFKVVKLPQSLLLAFVCFITSLAFDYIDTLTPIFTVQGLGWTDQAYSKYFATAKLLSGIIGMLLGGWLIDKFGKKRMLNIYFLLLIVISAFLASMQMHWMNKSFIHTYMIVHQFLYVFVSIGIFAIAMECCWKRVSATQFTLYMTVANMGRTVGAALIGPMKENFDWSFCILAFTIFMAIALIVMQFFHSSMQVKKVEELEGQNKV